MSEHDDFTPEDPLPALVAAVDQAGAMAPLLAQVAMAYFRAFVAEGFTEKQALYMTAVQLKENPGTAP